MVVYLVRSLGLMPESTSHDWHVQPSCQRPNRGPPERREFSPGENARKRIRLSSKLDKHTGRRISRQSTLPTEFPDDFHIGNLGGGRAAGCNPGSRFLTMGPFGMTKLLGLEWRSRKLRATVWSSDRGQRHFGARFYAARYGRQKIEKRSCSLEVLALKVPFGAPFNPDWQLPNEVPWPGRLRTLRCSLKS
jgi:hypothetical protein